MPDKWIWLVPVVLFWLVAVLYFGALTIEVRGGTGFRQFVGLVLTFGLFLVVWGVLHSLVGADTVKGALVASAVAVVGLPIEARVGFRLMGASVGRGRASAH
jgi:hypothetical protein